MRHHCHEHIIIRVVHKCECCVTNIYRSFTFIHTIHPFVRSYTHCALKSSGPSNHIQILRVSIVHGETFVHTFCRQTTQPPHHVMRSVQTSRSAAAMRSPVSSSVTIRLDCWAREIHCYKIAVRRIALDSGFRWFFFDFSFEFLFENFVIKFFRIYSLFQ